MRAWTCRRCLTVVVTAVALLGSACSASDGGGGGGEAACAAEIQYRGDSYWGHGGLKVDPPTTGTVVTGVLPDCDDSGGQDTVFPDRDVDVEELEDLPLETAFLWHGDLYVRDGRDLPRFTPAWFRG
jgi:hypothetical protein